MGWIPALAFVAAGACGGGGDKPPVFTPVSVTSDGSIHTLTLGDLKMVVDGTRGARITEFSLQGTSVLVTREVNHDNYGSTYWPSPQASWCALGGGCWPPPAAIDSGPYTADADATDSIGLASGVQAIAGIPDSAITVTKVFTPVPGSGAIDVTYALFNISATVSVSLAPWQVSRVAAGGLAFFGPGSGQVTYAPDTSATFHLDAMAGALWYPSGPVTHDSKAFADSTGWLAQVTPERLLYLVSYPDIQPTEVAPGEGEIELFTNGEYVEVEQQGALAEIPAGGSLTWTVRWKLRRVPGGTTVAPGNADLLSFATTALAE